MNKKLVFLSLPAALIPYLTLLAMTMIFFAAKVPLFDWLMENVFCNNALSLLAVLVIFCILAIVLTVICFVVSIRKNWDVLEMAKTVMIIKCLQIPAYLLIYVFGVICALTIFAVLFSIVLFIVDCLCLCMTGLLVIASAINAVKTKKFTCKSVFWILLLQFVFVADVIASIIFYNKLKRMDARERSGDNELAPN